MWVRVLALSAYGPDFDKRLERQAGAVAEQTMDFQIIKIWCLSQPLWEKVAWSPRAFVSRQPLQGWERWIAANSDGTRAASKLFIEQNGLGSLEMLRLTVRNSVVELRLSAEGLLW